MAFTKGVGGRPKGAKNKASVDIRELIHKTVKWDLRVQNLVKLADGGNVQAEKLLWEYGFGKPAQEITTPTDKPIEHNHTITPSDKLIKMANTLADRN